MLFWFNESIMELNIVDAYRASWSVSNAPNQIHVPLLPVLLRNSTFIYRSNAVDYFDRSQNPSIILLSILIGFTIQYCSTMLSSCHFHSHQNTAILWNSIYREDQVRHHKIQFPIFACNIVPIRRFSYRPARAI